MYKFSLKIKKVYINLTIGLILVLLFSQLFTNTANAAIGINRQINFQGKLVNNPSATNISNTTYTVVFTFYDKDSGGTALWSETQSVTTTDGIFRVALGSVTPFPDNFNFNWSGLYLGIEVNAPINDPEMTPRIQIAAVPFAFNAEKVAGLTVQDTSGNASTSGTLQIANTKTVSFADAFTTSGSFPLTLTTTASTNVTLPTTGTLLTNTATLNQTITSTQTTGNVLSLTDSTGLTGGITGLTVSLTSSTNSQNKTGISFDLSGGSSGVYYDLLGTGSTWSITRAGVLSVASCSGCGGGGTNWWNQLSGALTPVDSTNDFLLGSTATSSALFSYTGIKTGNTIASASGNLIVMPNNGWGGQVGIGTTNPTAGYNLDVVGRVVVGNQQGISLAGNKSIYIMNQTTDTVSDNSAIAGSLDANPSGSTAKYYFGGLFNSSSTTGNVQNFTGRLVGFQGQVNHFGTGTVAETRGFAGYVININGGTLTNAFAGKFQVQNTGAGQVSTGYGVYILGGLNNGGGTFLNNYGLYLEDSSLAGSTNNYSIYAAGGGSHNYFAGNVGIGTTAVGNGQLVVNQTNFAGTGDIFAASTSGTTKFVIANSGAITTGTWNGTAIGVAYGGINLTTVAAGSVLAANSLDTLSAITSTSGLKVLQNSAGTTSWATTTGTGNVVYDNTPTLITPVLGVATGTSLALGTNPAAAGTLRLPNATYITARNAANSADINMIQINASNLVALGANTAAFTLGGTVTGNSQNITGAGAITATSYNGNTFTTGTGTITLAAGTTVSFADAFTTSGAFPLTLTSTATTNATIPSGTVTLVDLATSQSLTNKTIGSTGLTFSAAATDITTGTNEDFTLTPNGTGKVVLGTTTNGLTFDPAGATAYTGTGRITKRITLTPEYAGASLTADGTSNTGSMTSDNQAASPYRNFYKWTNTQGTAQDYDIWVTVPLPADYSAMAATPTLSIDTYTSDLTNGTVLVTVYDTNNTADCTDVAFTPTGAINTWESKTATTCLDTGTYAANGIVKIKLHVTGAATTGDTRVSTIFFNYLAKF